MKLFTITPGTLADSDAITTLYRAVAAIAGGLARTAEEIADEYSSQVLQKSVASGQSFPNVSSLNFTAGQIVPNSFVMGLGGDGWFNIQSSTSTYFIVDVTGYYSNNANADANCLAGLLFRPLTAPVRLLDTRAGFAACDAPGGPLAAGRARTQAARTACSGVPATAQVVVGNATVMSVFGENGFATLWPSGAAQPNVSNLNYVDGQIVPNSFTVGLGAADGAFKLRVTGKTHFIVDLSGYFAP